MIAHFSHICLFSKLLILSALDLQRAAVQESAPDVLYLTCSKEYYKHNKLIKSKFFILLNSPRSF